MLMMALFLRMEEYCQTTFLEEFKKGVSEKVKFISLKSIESKMSPLAFLSVNCLIEMPNFTLPDAPDSNSIDGFVLLTITIMSSFLSAIISNKYVLRQNN